MGGKKKRAAAEAKSEEQAFEKEAELKESSAEGMQYGREKFRSLFGTDAMEVGDMLSSSLDDLEANRGRYSGASDAIRQKGNQAAMQARQRSGQLGTQTAAQQAQIGTAASQAAANQRYAEQQQAENTYRHVASSLASNAVTIEQAYGAQKLAEVRPLSMSDMAPPKFFG